MVTGGAMGIGYAIAHRLAEDGNSVAIFDLNGEVGTTAATTIATDTGARVICCAVDVADRSQVAAAVDRVHSELGPIGILVNNAGQAYSAPLLKTDLATWRRLLDVNLTGAFLCTRACLPDMIAAGHGRIVNVASIAGLTGAPYITAYCASKHGVIGLTRALAREVAPRDITVNAICPGYTDTDIVRDALANIRAKTGRSEAEALAALTAANPQGRLITPEEVAHAVLWLCLPGTQSITGQSLPLAGGEIL